MSKYKLLIELGKEQETKELDLHAIFINKFSKIVPLLPLTLLIGIITQIILLSRYNALILFSWSQVVNDTVLLCIPFSVMAVGVYFGQTDREYIVFKKMMVWRFFVTLFIGLFLAILTTAIFPEVGLIPLYLLGMYILGLGYYHSLSGPNPKPAKLNIRNFWRPLAMYICVLLTFGMLYIGLIRVYSTFTQKAYVLLDNGKMEKILYLNDKYIIYGTGNIVPKTDKITIVTGSGSSLGN